MGESIRSVSSGYVTLMQECVSVMAFRSPETGCVCVCVCVSDLISGGRKHTATERRADTSAE